MSKMISKLVAAAVLATGLAGVATTLTTTPAAAGEYAAMDCDELWYARNKIYADNGYCFKTAKARAVFGKGCFYPYGKLSKWEQKQVNMIRKLERFHGCSAGY